MLKRCLIFLAFVTGILQACNQSSINTKTFTDNYSVEPIPNIESFYKLSPEEKHTQQQKDKRDQARNSNDKKDWLNNRSRILLKSFSDGKEITADSPLKKGMPAPCKCSLNGDTINIATGLGLQAGFGFILKIYNTHYKASYYEYTDDFKIFKNNLIDTSLSKSIRVDNQYQSLIFKEQPTFQYGQQLTGYLNFTSVPYYQLQSKKLAEHYLQGKLYFTCKTQF
jgi:hypothetical protein